MRSVLTGTILHAPKPGVYAVLEHGCIALDERGAIEGLFPAVPERYRGVPVVDYGDRLIVQSFCDMHLHAPQYAMLGTGMDLPLLDWLQNYTFPTEALFADAKFARRVYGALARALVRHGTTRVCMFASLHVEATLLLMEALEQAGIEGYVGKVSMDRNGIPALQETTEGAKRDLVRWLDGCDGFRHVRPILTPRFTPSCTDELMRFLGDLARERNLRVQSHLSENPAEMALVRTLHPDCAQYWESYDKFGLLRPGTVMAHCVYSDAREQTALRDRGAVVAHCPDSNVNICSGFAPVRDMLDRGLSVTLGSDIAGGALLPMQHVVTAAVRASNVRRVSSGWETAALTTAEAYYLGTTAGAKTFGAGEGFAVGDLLHALVLDDADLPPSRPLSAVERFERLLYLGDDRNIVARYGSGRLLEL